MTPEERRAHVLGTVGNAMTAEYNRGRQEVSQDIRGALQKLLEDHGSQSDGDEKWYARSAGDWILDDVAELLDRLR